MKKIILGDIVTYHINSDNYTKRLFIKHGPIAKVVMFYTQSLVRIKFFDGRYVALHVVELQIDKKRTVIKPPLITEIIIRDGVVSC